MTTDTHEPSDPSASVSAKPDRFSFEWWEARGNVGRCKAHRKNGDRCKRPHDPGAVVCGHHGARAPAVRAKARQRLEEASDRMARALLGMASDANVSEGVRLAAIKDALSRAGITEKTAVEVEVSLRPWEQVMTEVAEVITGSREDFRRQRDGLPPTPPALAGQATETQRDPDGYLVAEVVDPNDGADLIAAMAYSHVIGEHQADTQGNDDHPRDRRTAAQTGQAGGMTLEEANAEALRLRRNAPPMRPPAGLRALPPGRSDQ